MNGAKSVQVVSEGFVRLIFNRVARYLLPGVSNDVYREVI